MSWPDVVLVFFGGMAAGAINTVVGSGTLITFPVLLAVGYSPIVANVSNTIGLVPGSLAGAWGYRRELAGQGRRVIKLLLASVVGGVVGAVSLLVLPAAAFKSIVPAFIVIALVLVLAQPRLSRALAARGRVPTDIGGAAPLLGLFLCGIYGGYFGAAQGIIILALLGFLTHESLQHANGIKNVLAGATNLVAGIIFAFAAHVNWPAAAVIAVGATIGGVLGARIGRRLSPPVLRGLIVVVGCAAIAKLVL
ncbi:MAG TPA: sulfite exporter TauE/SafE family protein [Gaiellaceae bacterium]